MMDRGTEGGATVRDRLWLWGHDAGAHNDGSSDHPRVWWN